jgi:hypothetical protein
VGTLLRNGSTAAWRGAILAGTFLLRAGIRDFVSVLQASPLCGAAPTFLCSGKEK